MLRYCWLALLLGVLAASPATAQDKNPIVIIDTSMGSITVELFPEITARADAAFGEVIPRRIVP